MNKLKVYKFIVNMEKKVTPSLDTGCQVGGFTLTLGLLLLSSTLSIRDALRSKNLTRLLITGNFYTTKLIRLIPLCLVLYSLLRSHQEPLTILRLARNQYVNITKHESIDRKSQRNNIKRIINK